MRALAVRRMTPHCTCSSGCAVKGWQGRPEPWLLCREELVLKSIRCSEGALLPPWCCPEPCSSAVLSPFEALPCPVSCHPRQSSGSFCSSCALHSGSCGHPVLHFAGQHRGQEHQLRNLVIGVATAAALFLASHRQLRQHLVQGSPDLLHLESPGDNPVPGSHSQTH